MKNLNVDVAEQNGNIVFLHKIVEGSASRSYGIHVARLAGIPRSLLERAQEKLSELESEKPHKDMASVSKDRGCEEQISMFSPEPSPVLDKLRTLNLMEITPSQAIKILEELKSALDK